MKPSMFCHNNPVSARVHRQVWRVFAIILILLGIVYYIYQDKDVWSAWRPAAELRHPEYGETLHEHSVFRTQINTWSNLPYVVLGLYAITLGLADQRVPPRPERSGFLVRTPGLSILFGAACCYLGLGSGMFHASLTRWGQQLDVAAMFSPLLALIAIHLGRRFPRLRIHGRPAIPTWPLLAALVVIACGLLYRFKWSFSASHLLIGLILTVAVGATLDWRQWRSHFFWCWLAGAALTLVLAVMCRQLDVHRHFTGPESWLQGHALWHLFTCLSLACMYLYHHSAG